MNVEKQNHTTSHSILEDIVSHLSLFLFLLDKDRCFIATYNTPQALKGEYTQQTIIGKHLEVFIKNPDNPFYQACISIDQVFDEVLETGIPKKIQYQVFDRTLEAIVSRIQGEIIMGEVRDITNLLRTQQAKELKRQKELSMALTAGNIASWCYDHKTDLVTSTNQNDIIGAAISRTELLNLVIPEHRSRLENMYSDLLHQGIPRTEITLKALNQQGIPRWYRLHAIPDSYSPDGSVSRIIGSQKDITEEYNRQEELQRSQKEAIAANKLLLTLIDFIPCPFFIKDAENEFRYIIANQFFCQENGLSQEEIIGRNDFEICLPEGARRFYKQDLEAINSEKACVFEELEISRPNKKTKIWQTTKARFISSGSQRWLIGIMLDMTDKTKVLEQMQLAKKIAERSDKLKSAFLANMSHEIRTPLNAIVGFSQLLSETANEEERNTYVNIINTNSEQLLTLINDILDLSKIESGYIDCKNAFFNINRLMNDLEVTFSPKILPSVKLTCTLPEEDFQVNLDRFRVLQIMTNFITNAIKFTSEGTIEFGYQYHKNGIKLFVKDTGSGIKQENLPKVFDRFEKFDPFKQGTGLGTSICKAITDAYNGEIGVTSRFGEGSHFWAYLPTELGSL